MMFVDSNVIAYAFYENKHLEQSQDILTEGGITNTLTLVEAYNIIQHETTSELATNAIRSLLKSNLKIVDVNVNLIYETLKRAQKHKKLSFLDLLHFTTALLYNCTDMASYDADFEGLEIKRVC